MPDSAVVGPNLAEYVAQTAAARRTQPALVVGATRWSWQDVDEAVTAAASGFRTIAQAGDRVGLVLDNCPEFVIAYFGVLRAGLVAVPLNPGFTATELAACLGDAGVTAVVADAGSAAAVRRAALSDVELVVVGREAVGERRFDDVLAAGRRQTPAQRAQMFATSSDLAVILYTSGTTGSPRGAMLTHAALRASVEQVASVEAGGQPLMTRDDVVLGVLPLAHVYSLNGTLGAWALSGSTLVISERFDPEATARLLSKHNITNIPGAPPMWSAWSQRPDLGELLHGVRVMFSGSAPLPTSVLAAVREATGKPIYEGYGLTEAAPGVSSTFASPRVKPGSVGRPFPGVEVKLLDDDGAIADVGDPGEIWIRGPNVFAGYWPDAADGPDADGWFATGDVAYADEDGDLFLVDRRKELIIVNGFNVYPREVEAALLQASQVAEAAVVGAPDERSGETVKAFVVLAPGVVDSPQVLDQIARSVTERLARFKRPSTIEVVAELPHSVTGKVAKQRLRDTR